MALRVRTPAGRRIHAVKVQAPNFGSPPSQPDGDYADDWTDVGPAWHVSIAPYVPQDVEKAIANTTIAGASHVVTGAYRTDVTVKTRLLVDGSRAFNIISRADPDERHMELILICQEVIA